MEGKTTEDHTYQLANIAFSKSKPNEVKPEPAENVYETYLPEAQSSTAGRRNEDIDRHEQAARKSSTNRRKKMLWATTFLLITLSLVLGAVNMHLFLKAKDESAAANEGTFPSTGCDQVHESYAKHWNGTGGVFDIYQNGGGRQTVEMYCDLTTDGGGWTVFQRRMDGSVNFNRGWDEYVIGFGEKVGEFWLGLETIHQMSKDGLFELRIDLTAKDGSTAYAKYGTFIIDGSSNNYRLHFGQYSGTAGDSLSHGNDNAFSSPDRDHDGWSAGSCAAVRKGGWWFNNCAYSNLNGEYDATGVSIHGGYDGLEWRHWKGSEPVRSSEMKFRKKQA